MVPMSELNPSQRVIAETTEGMIVVDAGPGTGKTHTIVERYINLIRKDGVSPSDVLLLTFTNNAAEEMDSRIKSALSKEGMESKSKLVQTKTFDSFCLSVIMDAPDQATRLFGMQETLTRGAAIVQNYTLNLEWFSRFFDDFLSRKGEDYGDVAVIGSQCPKDIFDMINRLMARGIFPLRQGWFGDDAENQLLGCRNQVLADLENQNVISGRKSRSDVADILSKMDPKEAATLPSVEDGLVSSEALEAAAFDDRADLFEFIHDVYYDYIRKSIDSDRLTFGINATLAFAALYNDRKLRERNSYRYVMIDEFQDTNSNQLMIALMILKEPNLCVVGDWKQGIYGFRFVSIDNIINFDSRVRSLTGFLNMDSERIAFEPPLSRRLSLDVNYRSSDIIVDKAFECLTIKGSKDEPLDIDEVNRNLTRLESHSGDFEGHTEVLFSSAESKGDEPALVVKAVRNYMGNPGYAIRDGDGFRRPRFGDIAVLCRTTADGVSVLDALQAQGIPAFIQGDIKLMATREGKLALAWLRFVNNINDRWGYIPIMADMGYTPAECNSVRDHKDIPAVLTDQRDVLYAKRRRPTDLLSTMYAFYGLDNDYTQAIISVLSSSHRSSLLTISDLARMIEVDIQENATYPVENSSDSDSVVIMTMHRSKGLEFPIVIVPFVDPAKMPARGKTRERFLFDERMGIRCTLEIEDFGGYRKIVNSWKTQIVRKSKKPDYDEERRLMFVALSRAKQYETVICAGEGSSFMKGLCDGEFSDMPLADLPPRIGCTDLIDPPDISGYSRRRMTLGVHSLMDFDLDPETEIMLEDGDEFSGRGKDYGTKVHDAAQMIFEGIEPKNDYPELDNVRKVIDGVRGADLAFAEMDCALPVDGTDVVLKGRIDLIAVFEDRVEVHDYKTDLSDRFESEYRLQLSVYGHVASRFYNKPVRCYIDYVALGTSKEVDVCGMEEIRRRTEAAIMNKFVE